MNLLSPLQSSSYIDLASSWKVHMAPNAKSTSTGPQPQARILKSTKENTTYQVQTRPQAPAAMKKSQVTANGSRPLQTSQAPLQHAETAALLARIAAQDGQFFYYIFFITIIWLIFV